MQQEPVIVLAELSSFIAFCKIDSLIDQTQPAMDEFSFLFQDQFFSCFSKR